MNYIPGRPIRNVFPVKKSLLLRCPCQSKSCFSNSLPFSQKLNPDVAEPALITVLLQQYRPRLGPFRPTGTGLVLQLDVIMNHYTILPYGNTSIFDLFVAVKLRSVEDNIVALPLTRHAADVFIRGFEFVNGPAFVVFWLQTKGIQNLNLIPALNINPAVARIRPSQSQSSAGEHNRSRAARFSARQPCPRARIDDT